MRWAFGDEYESLINIDIVHCLKAWNERHGDKLRINLNGHRTTDEEAMLNLYKETNDVKAT
jgi:hypothetical protein